MIKMFYFMTAITNNEYFLKLYHVIIFIHLTEATFTCNVAVKAPINSRCFTCSSLHKTWHCNNSGSFECSQEFIYPEIL